MQNTCTTTEKRPSLLIIASRAWHTLSAYNRAFYQFLSIDRTVLWLDPRSSEAPQRNHLTPIAARFYLLDGTANSTPETLQQTLEQLQMGTPLLWLQDAKQSHWQDQINHAGLIYHKQHTPISEDGSAEDQRLRQQARLYIDETFLAQQNDAYQALQTTSPALDLPQDGRPIAGYIGPIDANFDQLLMANLTEQLPEWHFVLIGKVSLNTAILRQRPNVHFLGQRPRQEWPRYYQHWQASLLPLYHSSQACDDAKTAHYSGKPLLATPEALQQALDSSVTLSRDAQALAHALSHAAKSPARGLSNQPMIRKNSWQSQAIQLFSALQALALNKEQQQCLTANH